MRYSNYFSIILVMSLCFIWCKDSYLISWWYFELYMTPWVYLMHSLLVIYSYLMHSLLWFIFTWWTLSIPLSIILRKGVFDDVCLCDLFSPEVWYTLGLFNCLWLLIQKDGNAILISLYQVWAYVRSDLPYLIFYRPVHRILSSSPSNYLIFKTFSSFSKPSLFSKL